LTKELLLGLLAVGLWMGVWVGRATERAERSKRDRKTAETTYTKAKRTAVTQNWRLAGILAGAFALLSAIFIAVVKAAPH
jgi:hypothetical protein